MKRPPRRWTAPRIVEPRKQVERILAMYAEGEKVDWIAYRCGVSHGYVSKTANLHGLRRRKRRTNAEILRQAELNE